MELIFKIMGIFFALFGLVKNFIKQEYLDVIDEILKDSLELINTDIGGYFSKSLKITIWWGKGIFTLWISIFFLGVIVSGIELTQTNSDGSPMLPSSFEESIKLFKDILTSDPLTFCYDLGKFAVAVVLFPFIVMQIFTVLQLLVVTLLKFPKGVLEAIGFILGLIGFYDEITNLFNGIK